MNAFEKYVTRLRLRWLRQDLNSRHTYYPKDKLRAWISELEDKLKNK